MTVEPHGTNSHPLSGDEPKAEEERIQTKWKRLTLCLIKIRFFPVSFDSSGLPYFKLFSLNTLIFFIVYIIGCIVLINIGRFWPPVNKLVDKPIYEAMDKLGHSPTDSLAGLTLEICYFVAIYDHLQI